MAERWDLFCRVVDNYGDVGIAWRLARQLASDSSRAVRLLVDGLDVFASIEPRVDANADRQRIDGIEIVVWPGPHVPFDDVADVVLELLGCGLPERYLTAMHRRAIEARSSTVWIDFEHLSAESWVDGFHGLPSPHPRLAPTKHFFYPGFGPRTGGLPIEPDLARRRAAFLASPQSIADLWRRLGLAPPVDDELRLSMFAYAGAPLAALLKGLVLARRRSTIVVPDGVLVDEMRTFVGDDRSADVSVATVPWLDQATYDRLLWACDVNFVRGEDSWVRAQAAGRPLVWQIYRQSDDAHRAKLVAFEDRHEAGLALAARIAQRAMSQAWNGFGETTEAVVDAWLAELPVLASHAESWRVRRSAEAPLIDRLLAFAAALRVTGTQAGLLD